MPRRLTLATEAQTIPESPLGVHFAWGVGSPHDFDVEERILRRGRTWEAPGRRMGCTFMGGGRFFFRALILVAFAGGVAIAAVAHADDGRIHVVLVDGSEVQGELVEKVPGDHLTIQLATGEIRTIPWASIQ